MGKIHLRWQSSPPHITNPNQISSNQRPHASKDRPIHCIVKLPPAGGNPKPKSCGPITLYAARWSIATTEGRVMINANATITRCVRSALLTHCAEIIIPMRHLSANSQCATAFHNPTTPENITQALDQVISLLDPRMAAAIMAMQPNSIPPGDAAII